MSTPRDYNQPPWPQRPNPGPDPRQAPGYPPQQAGNPFAQPPPQWGQPQPQWGQPAAQYGQPPGQYAQPPAQYGQPSAPPVPTTPRKSGSKSKPFLIAGAVVGVLLIVVIVVVVLSVNRDVKKVAVADVQTEVQQVLVDRVVGYSSGDITDVKCNNGQDPTVKKGGSFTCNVTVRGKQHQLTVTFKDANGTYEVGLPQLDGGK